MRQSITWLVVMSMLLSGTGCSRQFWRRQADRDSYKVITEKLNDPHWQLPRIDVTPDPRSRFYDPFDPDCEPMPPDDPAAHHYMQCINGYKGSKTWDKFGRVNTVENPSWLENYGVSVVNGDPTYGHSGVKLMKISLPQAMELAYLHSRDYQTNIEDLYLSALALTQQRYAMGIRFLGTRGTEPGASLATNSNSSGILSQTAAGNFGLRQLLPAGGQIAVELANTITWGFNGDRAVSSPTFAYSVTQPLLFNAGRKIALEPLTQAERNVLYDARTLARFRQILFVQVTNSYLNLLSQRQNILNSENNIRQREEQLEAQRVINERKFLTLSAPLAVLPFEIPAEHEAHLSYTDGTLNYNGLITDEIEQQLYALSDDEAYQGALAELIGLQRQTVNPLAYFQQVNALNQAQSGLASSYRQLADQQDNFKVLLGLPPNVQLEIDETMLGPFELISFDLIDVDTKLRVFQAEVGDQLQLLADDEGANTAPELSQIADYVRRLNVLSEELYQVGLVQIRDDFAKVQEILELTADDWQASRAGLRYFGSEEERNRVIEDLEGDLRIYRDSERAYALGTPLLEMLTDLTKDATTDELLQRLDQNRSGRIEVNELPTEWAQLPAQIRLGIDEEGVDGRELLVLLTRAARTVYDEHLLAVARALQVVQAGVRVEAISLNRFALNGTDVFPDIEEVVRIGLENRHDLMNARANVMDLRRRMEIAGNALEAGLDVTISGTQGLNPDADGRTGHAASLSFTTPLDQIDERNTYRTALINYQRARRDYMQQEDQVKQQIRQSWRQLKVQEL
ncbi:MAG: TolC family protein, partial [Planctomycetaceae bacterium]|nr:TolC family protein [Planctomycetaceae bacterium]